MIELAPLWMLIKGMMWNVRAYLKGIGWGEALPLYHT